MEHHAEVLRGGCRYSASSSCSAAARVKCLCSSRRKSALVVPPLRIRRTTDKARLRKPWGGPTRRRSSSSPKSAGLREVFGRTVTSVEGYRCCHHRWRDTRPARSLRVQRVGFAMAMVSNPILLLMDEPFSALDVLSTETLRTDFSRSLDRASAADQGRTHGDAKHRGSSSHV